LPQLVKVMLRSPIHAHIKKSLEKSLGIGQAFSGIFVLLFVLCAYLHIQSCIIVILATFFDVGGSWMANHKSASIFAKYTWSLFQAVGNTFPLTYKPDTTEEQWAVIVFVVSGAALYACIVGSISSFAMGLDAAGKLFKQKMDELNDYMTWKNLNPITRHKVRRYYEIKYRGKFFEEATLLAGMNESLRSEIAIHNCRELITKVPFLRREENDGRDEMFIGKIATSLVACYFVAGDVVISQGEIGSEMFFILNGKVSSFVFRVVSTIFAFTDDSVPEVALIANIPRTATVQAASASVLYRLSRSDFMAILAEFEDMRIRIDRIYQERMEKVRLEQEARRKLEEAKKAIEGSVEAKQEEKAPIASRLLQSFDPTNQSLVGVNDALGSSVARSVGVTPDFPAAAGLRWTGDDEEPQAARPEAVRSKEASEHPAGLRWIVQEPIGSNGSSKK
ncbi:anaphase-promoting complex subunit Hcn1, partial [Chytridiales sp. JEL 0842]